MSEVVKCPTCEAPTPPNKTCWLCHGEVGSGIVIAETVEENPYASPVAPKIAGEVVGHNVVVICLFVGLCVVTAALAAVAPGLAVIVGIIGAPALVRTAVVIYQKQQIGIVATAADTSMLFAASVAGVAAAAAAAGAAFFGACTATCFGALAITQGKFGDDSTVAIIIGVSSIVSLAVGGWVLRALWKRRR